jgi:hypothetical protein
MPYRPADRFEQLIDQLLGVSGAGSREILRKKHGLVAAYGVRVHRYAKIGAAFTAHCRQAGIFTRADASPSLSLARAVRPTLAGLDSAQTRLAQLVDRAIDSGLPSKAVYEFVVEEGLDTRFRRKIKRR